MAIESISMTLAITIWTIGAIWSFKLFLNRFIADSLYLIVLSFLCGAFLGIPSFISIVHEENVKYVDPTFITRTNDLTHIIYINNDTIHTVTHSDAKYWNSTNIKVKVYGGKNIWGIGIGTNWRIGIYQ